MARRSGVVDVNQFDFQNFASEAPAAYVRQDSAALDAREKRDLLRFGGVTTDSAVAQPEIRKRKSVFDFKFGGQGLSHKGSVARFFEEREDVPQHRAAPVKQLRRKKRISNLNLFSAAANEAEAIYHQRAVPAEEPAVRSLRRSFSKAALRLGVGKRKHAEVGAEEGAEEVHELDSRPVKRVRLPEIAAEVSKWARGAEAVFDVVKDNAEVYQENEDYARQQQRNPNFVAARLSECELDASALPEIPPRNPLRLQRAREVKQVRDSTLAQLEGREKSPLDPLTVQQMEEIRRGYLSDVHPALRGQEAFPAELHSDPARALHPKPLGSNRFVERVASVAPVDHSQLCPVSNPPPSMFPMHAMLDQAIREQYEAMGVSPRFGGSYVRRQRLQEAVRHFDSWDDFARAVAEQ